MLGSRIASSVSYSSRNDGSRGELVVTRPFFSLQTPFAVYTRLEGFDQLDAIWADGERVDQLTHDRRWADLELARAVARSSSERRSRARRLPVQRGRGRRGST